MSHVESTPISHAVGASVPLFMENAAPNRDRFFRFSVAEFDRLGELRFFPEDIRVELLEGFVVMVSPIGSGHAFSTEAVGEALRKTIPAGWITRTQQPIVTPDSEPQPDCCVVRGDLRKFADHHPGPDDIAIVIEVADRTLNEDRSTKQRIYAKAGIANFWIVNLPERQLEVHRRPISETSDRPARYETIDTFDAEQAVEVMLDGVHVGSISVRELLP